MPETDQLRQLIGRRVQYQGRELQVLDLLEDGPQLVLGEAAVGRIQGDQFGDARRRAPATWTIPVFEGGSDRPHPLLRELGLVD